MIMVPPTQTGWVQNDPETWKQKLNSSPKGPSGPLLWWLKGQSTPVALCQIPILFVEVNDFDGFRGAVPLCK